MSKWRSLQAPKGCGRADGCCGLPPGFFRLRYFYGKHLSVADFVDEQRYHSSKMRFHNQRLHGSGIFCGLGVELLEDKGPVLRVGRGAALDECGREIVVGCDQCVDVDGWFQREKKTREEKDPRACWPDDDRDEEKLRLCIVLRYAECPACPEPAPKDPCRSCDEAADYGRVTEGFELKLMLLNEAKAASEHELFPTEEQIAAAVAEATGGIDLLHRLGVPIRKHCPCPDGDGWLLLACFTAVLSDDQKSVAAIEDVDHDCASQVLLSTEVIQRLLADVISQLDPEIGAPSIIGVEFRRIAPTRYQMILILSDPIDPNSFEADDSFGLRKLAATGWTTPGVNALRTEYAEAADADHPIDGPALYVSIDNAKNYLVEGERYQLFVNPLIHPVVDANLQQLQPRHFAWRFTLATDPATGDLTIALPPFAVAP